MWNPFLNKIDKTIALGGADAIKFVTDPNSIGGETLDNDFYEVISQPAEDVSTPDNMQYQYELPTKYLTQPYKLPFKNPLPLKANIAPYATADDMILANEQNRTPPELQMPKTLPPFVGEYEKAKSNVQNDLSALDQVNNITGTVANQVARQNPFVSGPQNKGIGITNMDPTKSILLGNEENMTVDVPNFTDTTFPTEKPPTENVTTEKKNEFGVPEAYYLGKAGLDAVALFNNIIQPQPPSLQMKKTFFERQRLDSTQYEQARSDVKQQMAASGRSFRENISQASDLMKGVTALQGATQQNLAQIGVQEAVAEQQVRTINQQIANQEQQGIAATMNQEAMMNYEIQQKAQMHKDQMISAQLAALGGTAGAYAKYKQMKDIADEQSELNKSTAMINNELQAALVENELISSALDSDDYKDYKKSHRNLEMNKIKESLIGDEKYKTFFEYYNGAVPEYSTFVMNQDKPETYQKLRMINAAKTFEKMFPEEPKESDYTPEEWASVKKQYDENNKYYQEYLNDPKYKAYESEIDFWKEVNNRINTSEYKTGVADQYLKSRNMSTQSEIFKRLKGITDRSQQIIG